MYKATPFVGGGGGGGIPVHPSRKNGWSYDRKKEL